MHERTRWLEKHPEQRLRVDTEKLRSIIDYIDFKCHPDCSIARDEAVKGSDIDGGLVVTEKEVPVDVQVQFVNALREQGFKAYHPVEVDIAKSALETETDPDARRSMVHEYIHRSFSVIHFVKQHILEAEKAAGLWEDPNMLIYLAGASVGDSRIPLQPQE